MAGYYTLLVAGRRAKRLERRGVPAAEAAAAGLRLSLQGPDRLSTQRSAYSSVRFVCATPASARAFFFGD